MRLLDTATGYFHEINASPDKPYAILSHVWDPNPDGETSYQRLRAAQDDCKVSGKNVLSDPRVSDKIRLACYVAHEDGYRSLWLDSCCINKESSAELSEAINSMFEWYADASICYVFLVDVEDNKPSRSSDVNYRKLHHSATGDDTASQPVDNTASCSVGDGSAYPDLDPTLRERFLSSRWHTRGWTLQELIAPRTVIFLTSGWNLLGSKLTMSNLIEDASGVDRDILTRKKSLSDVSVAQRMWWASGRKTTRIEDEAYCLMGLFGVNLPTIYGEGRRAFIRLQEEIYRTIPDQSIFAWELSEHQSFERDQPGTVHHRVSSDSRPATLESGRSDTVDGLFALSPRCFALSKGLRSIPHEKFVAGLRPILNSTGPLPSPTYTITSYGVRGQVFLLRGFTLAGDLVHHPDLILLECEDTKGDTIALGLSAAHEKMETGQTDIGFTISPELWEESKVYRLFAISEEELCSQKTSITPKDACFRLRPSRNVLQEVSTDVAKPLEYSSSRPTGTTPSSETSVQVAPYHWCEALLKAHGFELHRPPPVRRTTGHDLHFFALRAPSASSSSDGTSPFISLPPSSIILCAVEVDDQRWIFSDDHVDCSVHIRLVKDFNPSTESIRPGDPIYEDSVKALDAAPTPPFGETSAKLTHPSDDDPQIAIRVWVEGSGGRKAPLIEKNKRDEKDKRDERDEKDKRDEKEKEDAVLWVGIDIHWKRLEEMKYREDKEHREVQVRRENQEPQPHGDEGMGEDGEDVERTGGDVERTGEDVKGTGGDDEEADFPSDTSLN